MSEGRARRFAVGLGAFAFSALFLYLAARRLDIVSIRAAWEASRPFPWVALAVVFYFAGHFARGQRLRVLVRRDATLSWLTATNIVVIGYATNNVLPARLGELARAAVLVERTGMPFGEAITITLIERLLDGIAILLLVGVALALGVTAPWLVHVAELAGLLFALAATLLSLVVFFPKQVLWIASRFFAPLGNRSHARALRAATHVINGGASLRDRRTVLTVSALSLAVWILEAGLFIAVFPAFDLPIHVSTGVLAMSATNLGIAAPSTPGYFGPFETYCVQALTSQGVAAATAAHYALLVHVAFFIPITAWGAGAILRYGTELGSALFAARAAKMAPEAIVVDGVEAHWIARTIAEERPRDPAKLSVALVEAFVGECSTEAAHDIALFVDGQIAALPPRLRSMFHFGMFVFRATIRLRFAASFCALPLARRRAIVEWWAFGRFGLLRTLFRPVRSLALFAYFERPEVSAKLGGARSLAVVTESRVSA